MGITDQIATFAANVNLYQLPPDVRAAGASADPRPDGNIVRARHDAESTPALLAAVRALGLAQGNAAVFGDAVRYAPAGAALVNGALAHSLDFDDTHAAGSLHPGVRVTAAALAAGEMAGAVGADALAAIVAGYEVTCRAALALPAGAHYDRGVHRLRRAARSARRRQRVECSGWTWRRSHPPSASRSARRAGSLQFLANGAWTKRFQVGWAALAGLTAATLAREGFKGASEALEGRHGFLCGLRPLAQARARDTGSWACVRVDGDGGEALSLLPLWPRQHRRGAGAAGRA